MASGASQATKVLDGAAVSTFSAQQAGRSQTPPVTKHGRPTRCSLLAAKSRLIYLFQPKFRLRNIFIEHPGGFDCTINWRDSSRAIPKS